MMAYVIRRRMTARPAGWATARTGSPRSRSGEQGSTVGESRRPDREQSIGPGPARRVLDIVLSLIALALLWPLLLPIAAAIRLSSPGPILFRQLRVGQGGRPFLLYKFRSMRIGGGGPSVTVVGDSRVTRVGHFLRATSLDELPQIVNVLRGEMTLVGPRPESVELAGRYPDPLTFIFRYRPGLTGPVQLNSRDELRVGDAEAESLYLSGIVPLRIELDMTYLRRPTVWRTLHLIWQTAAYLLLSSAARLRETRSYAR